MDRRRRQLSFAGLVAEASRTTVLEAERYSDDLEALVYTIPEEISLGEAINRVTGLLRDLGLSRHVRPRGRPTKTRSLAVPNTPRWRVVVHGEPIKISALEAAARRYPLLLSRYGIQSIVVV